MASISLSISVTSTNLVHFSLKVTFLVIQSVGYAFHLLGEFAHLDNERHALAYERRDERYDPAGVGVQGEEFWGVRHMESQWGCYAHERNNIFMRNIPP